MYLTNLGNSGYQESILGTIELIKPRIQLHQLSRYYQLNVEAYNNTFYMLLEKNNDLMNHPQLYDSTSVAYKGVVFQDYKPIEWAIKNNNSLDSLIQEKHISNYHDDIIYEKINEIGWARFSSNSKFDEVQGVFKFQGVMYHVQPSHIYSLNKHLHDPNISPSYARTSKSKKEANTVIYKSTDMELRKRGFVQFKDNCGIHNFAKQPTRNNIGEGLENYYKYALVKRDGQQSACGNTPKRVLYVSVVADCTYVEKYKGEAEARKQIIQEFNVVSGLYERTFNIQLGILKITVPLTQCKETELKYNRKCSDQYSLDNRLRDFSYWVATQNSTDIGIWHLLTDCRSNEQVGLAWVKTLCINTLKSTSLRQSTGNMELGTGVSSITRETWKVIAHEIGHNFGAIHDCIQSLCPCTPESDCTKCCPCKDECNCGSKFIMNPESKPNSDTFSPCSIDAICNTINEKITTKSCLHEPNYRPTVKEAMCGNGIVEKGEECDCGNNCQAGCCNQKTCKLKPAANCDDSNMECCEKCQIVKPGTVCRKSTSECDIQEECDGKSPICPKDIFVKDGTKCIKNSLPNGGPFTDLACAQGQCTSRDSQCYSRGSKMDITEQCRQPTSLASFGAKTCNLICAKPNDGLVCMELQGAFIDGTECGRNMVCINAECTGGNLVDKVATLFDNNPVLSISAAVILALLALSCMSTICCRYRKRNTSK